MVSLPGTIRHQPNFVPIVPSLWRNRGSARITPSAPRPPTQRSSLPKATDDPKSRSPMSSGALPGFVMGQFFASARVSGDGAAAGAALAATVEEGREVGLVPSDDATAAAPELGGGAGEHAANITVSSRRTAGVLTSKPQLWWDLVLILHHTPAPPAWFRRLTWSGRSPTPRLNSRHHSGSASGTDVVRAPYVPAPMRGSISGVSNSAAGPQSL